MKSRPTLHVPSKIFCWECIRVVVNLLQLPSSERSVFMDTEPLVTEACSDVSASDGEIRDPWNLPMLSR